MRLAGAARSRARAIHDGRRHPRPGAASAAGLLAGMLIDAVAADPARWHPVSGFGRTAKALEKATWAPRVGRGAVYTGVLVGGAAALGVLAERPARARAAVTAAACWTVIGGTSLARVAGRIAAAAQNDDLDRARNLLPQLVGRDPAALDVDGIVAAVVESVAENTSDAVVGALLWGAVAGVPGLLGYRAANTLDAMVGHRTPRYARFGTAAARLDDVANLLPARLTALLVVACAPLVGGSPREALRAWRRDAGAHPSPNAGVCEAAFAGALGIELGGRTVYQEHTEDRPLLGSGPRPTPGDVTRAIRLSRAVSAAAAGLAAAALVLAGDALLPAGWRRLCRSGSWHRASWHRGSRRGGSRRGVG